MKRFSLPLALLLWAALAPAARSASAFCGFYVAKADTKLFNKASQVVLVRDGDRTVLTMANDFKGDPKEFAVVIPVPTFIARGQIHVADKALIVSIYLTLGINGYIPRWLVIMVVSRDILIVGGIMLSWLIGNPLKIKPLLVSKLNTVAQIVFACTVLGTLGFGLSLPQLYIGLMGLVAALTLLSVAAYLAEFVRHMSDAGTAR